LTEQTSLLEMAVWKAAFIMQLDEYDNSEDEPKAKKAQVVGRFGVVEQWVEVTELDRGDYGYSTSVL
jgi:hypothetical protein